jgi:hypothetical protein
VSSTPRSQGNQYLQQDYLHHESPTDSLSHVVEGVTVANHHGLPGEQHSVSAPNKGSPWMMSSGSGANFSIHQLNGTPQLSMETKRWASKSARAPHGDCFQRGTQESHAQAGPQRWCMNVIITRRKRLHAEGNLCLPRPRFNSRFGLRKSPKRRVIGP